MARMKLELEREVTRMNEQLLTLQAELVCRHICYAVPFHPSSNFLFSLSPLFLLLSPSSLPPLSHLSPSSLPPLSLLSPSSLPPLSLLSPSSLPPLSLLSPSSLPPLSLLSPSSLPPLSLLSPSSLLPLSLLSLSVCSLLARSLCRSWRRRRHVWSLNWQPWAATWRL